MSAVRQSDGFTLIELVACIVIMAVLAAIAGPRFFDQQTFAARGYAGEVVAALRGARQTAVSSQCDVEVSLDPVTGYRVMQRALANCTGAFTTPVRLTDGNPLSNAPPSGVLLAPATQIIFGANGQVTGAAPPPLTVGTFTITVNQRSGFVGQ
jgi:MSHA pilin protein MshC